MGVAAAVVGTGLASAYVSNKAGKRAANASNNAANIQAQGEREKLDYLKQVEKLPLEIRDRFLPQLADVYSGGQGQQNLIDSAMQSPLYKQLIGNIEGSQPFAEEAILRNASATGGLRSGTANENLARLQFQQQNDKNAALTQTYGQQLQGIQGLAGINLNTNQIGNAIAAPSATQAAGMTAAAQAGQQGTQNSINNIMGAVGMGINAYSGAGGGSYDAMNYNGAGGGIPTEQWLASDIRLKEDIKHIGERNGFNWYSWTWADIAKRIGLTGESSGYMAHEVYNERPDAIGTINGHLVVNYKMLERH